MRNSKWIGFVAGLAVLLVLFSLLSETVSTGSSVSYAARRQNIVKDFKSQKPHTIDVVVLGDSESYTSVDTMRLWHKRGITAYVLGQPAAQVSEMARMAEQIAGHQKPKVVLVETNMLFRKVSMVNGAQNQFGQTIGEAFPIFQNHDFWKALFVKGSGSRRYNGFRVLSRTFPDTKVSGYMKPTRRTQAIPAFNQMMMDRIVRACRDNGSRVILYSAPSTKNYSMAKHNALEAYAAKLGVKYYDLNTRLGLTAIDWNQDTYDGGDHLNYNGAEKTTDALCAVLARCGLADHRGDKNYRAYAQLYRQYAKRVKRIDERWNRI